MLVLVVSFCRRRRRHRRAAEERLIVASPSLRLFVCAYFRVDSCARLLLLLLKDDTRRIYICCCVYISEGSMLKDFFFFVVYGCGEKRGRFFCTNFDHAEREFLSERGLFFFLINSKKADALFFFIERIL